jgi:hypothetical protein
MEPATYTLEDVCRDFYALKAVVDQTDVRLIPEAILANGICQSLHAGLETKVRTLPDGQGDAASDWRMNFLHEMSAFASGYSTAVRSGTRGESASALLESARHHLARAGQALPPKCAGAGRYLGEPDR